MKIVKEIVSYKTNGNWIVEVRTKDVYVIERLVLKQDYTPSKGDKIYVDPSVKFPRVKIKNWCKKSDIKTIRDKDKADYLFASTHIGHYSKIRKSFSWYKIISVNTMKKIMLPEVVEVLKDCELCLPSRNIDSIFANQSLDHGGYNTTSLEDYNILINLEKKAYSTNSLIDVAVEGNPAIDLDKFNSLKRMLNSENEKDVGTAMALMGASDYRKSYHFLLYLLYLCPKIRTHHDRNKIDFKSLDLYCPTISTWGGHDTIMDSLVERNLVTLEAITDISKIIKAGMPISNDFHIVNIGISDRLTRILKQQKLDSKNSKFINNKEKALNSK